MSLELPHACGVMTVGTETRCHGGITSALRLYSARTANAVTESEGAAAWGGETRLMQALTESAEQLYAFKSRHKDSRLRILAITDGEDTSGDSPLEALRALLDADVVLDVVVLGSAPAGPIAAIAVVTGGVVLQPTSVTDALVAFESDALLQLSSRVQTSRPAVPGSLKEFNRSAQIQRNLLRERWQEQRRQKERERATSEARASAAAAKAEEEEKRDAPKPGGALFTVNLGGASKTLHTALASTAALFAPATAPTEERVAEIQQSITTQRFASAAEEPKPRTPGPRTGRTLLLMKQLQGCIESVHDQVTVHCGDSLETWQVVLKGPDDPSSL